MATVSLVVRREGSFLRPYAMKRFHHRNAGDPGIKQMFLDEARIAGLLRHPNVVSVLDVGEDETGPFLIMDYVEGLSLAQLIRARQISAGEPVSTQIGLRILVQAARGLAAAHELTSPTGAHLELVHRDISPQNILLDLEGTVRIADFGIARAAGRATETENGVLKGKLGYLAPETLQFADSDHRVDLFALGIVAFELFTGRRLYRGGDVKETANRILHEPPPDLGMLRPDVPDGLVELVFSLLAKEPELRPATAREVADVLDHLLVDVVSSEGPTPLDDFVRRQADVEQIETRRAQLAAAMDAPRAVETAAPPARPRWPMALGAAALAGVVLIVGLGVGMGWWAEPSEPETISPIATDEAAETAVGETPSQESAADESAADESTPDDSAPDDSTPDDSTPDDSTPDDSAADESTELEASGAEPASAAAPPDAEEPTLEAPRPARRRPARQRRTSRRGDIPVVHEY